MFYNLCFLLLGCVCFAISQSTPEPITNILIIRPVSYRIEIVYKDPKKQSITRTVVNSRKDITVDMASFGLGRERNNHEKKYVIHGKPMPPEIPEVQLLRNTAYNAGPSVRHPYDSAYLEVIMGLPRNEKNEKNENVYMFHVQWKDPDVGKFENTMTFTDSQLASLLNPTVNAIESISGHKPTILKGKDLVSIWPDAPNAWIGYPEVHCTGKLFYEMKWLTSESAVTMDYGQANEPGIP